MTPTTKLFLCLAFMSTWLLSGCSDPEVDDSTLRVGNGPNPATLDPWYATGVSERNILSALHEGLVRLDPVSLQPVPGIAENWIISDDGLVYTFRIREGLTWSNGEPLDAGSVLQSLLAAATADPQPSYLDQLYAIRGYEAYSRGAKTRPAITQIGPQELRIGLSEPAPTFLYRLALPIAMPRYNLDNLPRHEGDMVVNGPFAITDQRLDQSVTVMRNPNYRDAEAIRLEQIEFVFFDDKVAELRAFEAGRLDATESAPVSALPRLRREMPDSLRIQAYLGTDYYLFNTQRPPLHDFRVRRALSEAIDRTSIVENITRGGQLPARHLYPGYESGMNAADRRESLSTSQELLAEAGYPGGAGFPKLTLLYNTSENHRAIAEAIQEQWREELGIAVELRNMEWKAMLAQRAAGDFEIMRASWIGDYPTASNFYGILTSGSGNNFSGWRNDEYDRAVADEAWSEAQRILQQEAPIAPIYFYNSVYLVRPYVKDWRPNLLDLRPWESIYIERP